MWTETQVTYKYFPTTPISHGNPPIRAVLDWLDLRQVLELNNKGAKLAIVVAR